MTTGARKYKVDTTKYSVRLEDAKIRYLKEVYGDMGITQLIDTLIDEKIKGDFTRPERLKSPVNRIGGKYLLAPKIVRILPPAKTYIDIFGGAAHVLMERPKEASKVEIYNDKNADLVALIKAIKDHPMQLREKIMEMPTSRAYFNELRSQGYVCKDNLDKASRFFYLMKHGYNRDTKGGFVGARDGRNSMKNKQKLADELIFISERFQDVIIEQKDWKHFFSEKFDKEDTLIFADPPYIIRNNRHGYYEDKFDLDDNRELAKYARMSKAKICVNHYEHYLYNKWYKDFYKYQIKTFKASGKVVNGKKPEAIESFYCNYDYREVLGEDIVVDSIFR